MQRILAAVLLLLCLSAPAFAAPAPFGVAAHSDVNIEWWYVNAHVTTDKGRHLAVVGSFFRFGNGVSPIDGATPQPRAHYLIYAVTDLDKKTQRSYSLADQTMVSLLPLFAAASPDRKAAKTLLAYLKQGKLPPPHQQIVSQPSVVNSPFHLAYGAGNTLTAANATNTEFAVNLDAGKQDKIALTLSAQKPAMAVGGNGETGLKRANDMYYFSLTRCAVGGTIDTGAGPEKIVGGQGWFDHQWGNSWVASNDGWDWWGIQLDDGTDILVFQQRDLATGKTFFPLATFMDKNGRQSVTKKIIFKPDAKSVWTSQTSGVKYPLGWTVTFPEKNLKLIISVPVRNQEMPILGPGGGIWEGSCNVGGVYVLNVQHRKSKTYYKTGVIHTSGSSFSEHLKVVGGVAYMELVGYSSPAVRAQLGKKR